MIRELNSSDRRAGPSDSHEHVYEISQGSLKAIVSNLGASLRSLKYKDLELTLGHADPETYKTNPPYFATTVGRFGNRIAEGTFTLDGKSHSLARNNGKNHLHGGPKGFHSKYWTVNEISISMALSDEGGKPGTRLIKTEGLRFSLESPDGDESYPGNLLAQVDILLSDSNELFFVYKAETSAPTVANLTNHAYWNMNGEGKGSIHDNVLRLFAAGHLEVDATSIPTGALVPLAGGPFDFSSPRPLAGILSEAGLSGSDIPAEKVHGVDHTFVADTHAPSTTIAFENASLRARKIAELKGKGGRMEVWTSLPGVQVYSANYLRGIPGRNGPHEIHAGLCLETQRFPDAPNQGEHFRLIGKKLGFDAAETASWDAVLRPGMADRSITIHRFG